MHISHPIPHVFSPGMNVSRSGKVEALRCEMRTNLKVIIGFQPRPLTNVSVQQDDMPPAVSNRLDTPSCEYGNGDHKDTSSTPYPTAGYTFLRPLLD